MADLDAMQLADVGAALWESVQKAGDNRDPPDWDYIVEATTEGSTLETVRGDVKNAIQMVRDEWEDAEVGPSNDERLLGEVFVRELEYRGYRIVRSP